MYDLSLKEGDIDTFNGHLKLIEKNEKLKQQIGKIVVTTIGWYLHPNYGSTVMQILGKPYSDLDKDLKASVRSALDYFISIQSKGVLFGIFDKEEILYKVAYINVSQFTGDPRGATLNIGLLDGTMQQMELSQVLS